MRELIKEIEAALSWPESVGYCISNLDGVATLKRIRKIIDRAKKKAAEKAKKRKK